MLYCPGKRSERLRKIPASQKDLSGHELVVARSIVADVKDAFDSEWLGLSSLEIASSLARNAVFAKEALIREEGLDRPTSLDVWRDRRNAYLEEALGIYRDSWDGDLDARLLAISRWLWWILNASGFVVRKDGESCA